MLFLVELGAAIRVASTTVLVLSVNPLVANLASMVASSWVLKLSWLQANGEACERCSRVSPFSVRR